MTEHGLSLSARTTFTTHMGSVPLKLRKSAQGNKRLRKSLVCVAGLSRFYLHEEEAERRQKYFYTLSSNQGNATRGRAQT